MVTHHECFCDKPAAVAVSGIPAGAGDHDPPSVCSGCAGRRIFLVSAAMFVNLDAVDVAFTEAAVGAGISTVLFLATMAYLPGREKVLPPSGRIGNAMAAGIICVFAGALLVAAAVELPAVGDPNAPAHVHVAPRYLAESDSFLHIPNVVTTVLASYRGFDTLGETVVVFTAGLGVLVLLSGFTRTRRAAQDRAGVKEDSDA